MKKHEWVNPNKMLFESEHKTFNKQCDCISTGNVWGGVQYSSYIRPIKETRCNGMDFEQGHLYKFDIAPFEKLVSRYDLSYATDLLKENGGILYMFSHISGANRIIDGLIATDKQHNHLITVQVAKGYKVSTVLNEAKKYISN